MEENTTMRKKQQKRVLAGLVLVGVGAALMLKNAGMTMPDWLFTWPVILILVGLFNGIRHNFKNRAWFILVGIGGLFLLEQMIPALHFGPFILPAAIIALGVLFILRPEKERWNEFAGKMGSCSRKQKEQDVEMVG